MSICSVCEALPPVKQCCNKPLCHLCDIKHKCQTQTLDVNRDLYQKVISNYESKLDSIHQLYNILLDDNKKIKQENQQLYVDNQAMILEIANLKEGTMIVETDLKKKEDMPLAPPKLIRQTNIATTDRRLTLTKSINTKPKK